MKVGRRTPWSRGAIGMRRPCCDPTRSKQNHVSSRDAPLPDAPFVGSIATSRLRTWAHLLQSPNGTAPGLVGVGRGASASGDRLRLERRRSRNSSATNGEFGDHVRGGFAELHPCFVGVFHATEGICQRLSKKQRAATPPEFRDLLLSIARTANVPAARGA